MIGRNRGRRKCNPYRVGIGLSFLHGYRESTVFISMVIRSFGDTATADFYHGRNTSRVRRFPQNIASVALRKLDVLNAARKLDDLRSPPGNHLEALKDDLEGFHCIRVNDQSHSAALRGLWRVTFRWNDGVQDVSLVDYHERGSMLPENRIPTHSGEILLEEFLNPLGPSQVAFAIC